MAHYDIFREQLAVKYPACGHALWEPNPEERNSPVKVGDVGFVRDGRFNRLFNALLSADHSSQIFGVPESYEPIFHDLNPSKDIDYSNLKPNHYYSYGINVIDTESDVRASKPRDFPQVSYLCRRSQCGAALFLPVQAQRQDVRARGAFGRWMTKHIDHCLAFTRRPGRELGIKMEDIILVTGCHRTRSWANAVFLESNEDVQVSFEVEVTNVKGPDIGIKWPFSPERVQGAMLNWGPEGKGLSDLPEDQCVFIRGFRVTRTLKIFPKHLIAAAGPSSDPSEDSHETDTGLASFPAITKVKCSLFGISQTSTKLSKYRDPLHILLEHIAERSPDCDMVLVHDDDLARICGVLDSHGSLQSDGVIHLLHKFQPKIQQITYDWQCGNEFSSKTGSETTTVAMFSEEYQEWGVPSPRISFGLVKSVDDPSDSRIGKGVMVAPKGLHVAAELDSASVMKHIAKSKALSEAEVRERPSKDLSIVCPIDNRIFLDAVKVPCCETAYCDGCVQTHLLESDFICPHCGSSVGPLDKLAVDKPMRGKVADYIMKEIEASQREGHGQITNESSSVSQIPTVKALQFGPHAQDDQLLDLTMSQLTIDHTPLPAQVQHTHLELQNTGELSNAVHELAEVQHQQRPRLRAPSVSSNSHQKPVSYPGRPASLSSSRGLSFTGHQMLYNPVPYSSYPAGIQPTAYSRGPPPTSQPMPPYTPIPFFRCDGFLVRMFGQRDAAFFIESLLKTNVRNFYPISNVPGWNGALMVQNPSASDARPVAVMPFPNNQSRQLWILDFVPSPTATIVVPQTIWTPPNQSDWRQYVEQANLRMPVFFMQSNGAIGLPLTRATAGDTATLHCADSPAPLGGGHSTQIRIAWPGYESWERQIQIRYQTRHRNEITLERFAKLVAGVVDRFLTHASSPEVFTRDPNWRIGEGGITRHHVIIVGTVQVSAGGWMPILQIAHPQPPMQMQHASPVHHY